MRAQILNTQLTMTQKDKRNHLYHISNFEIKLCKKFLWALPYIRQKIPFVIFVLKDHKN